ncbi:MAG: hypothetical protein WBR13_13045 [Allosphingosinicella sp.]
MANEAKSDPYAGVRRLDATEVRQSFSEVVGDAAMHGRRVLIYRNRRPLAAIVSLADLDVLLARDASRDKMMTQSPPASGPAISLDELAARVGAGSDSEGGDVQTASQGSALRARAAEAALNAITQMVVPQVVEAASRFVVERMNERWGEDHSLDEREESEMVEHVLACIQAAPVQEVEVESV